MQAILPGLWQLAHSGVCTPRVAAMVGGVGEGRRELYVVWCGWVLRCERGVYEKMRQHGNALQVVQVPFVETNSVSCLHFHSCVEHLLSRKSWSGAL